MTYILTAHDQSKVTSFTGNYKYSTPADGHYAFAQAFFTAFINGFTNSNRVLKSENQDLKILHHRSPLDRHSVKMASVSIVRGLTKNALSNYTIAAFFPSPYSRICHTNHVNKRYLSYNSLEPVCTPNKEAELQSKSNFQNKQQMQGLADSNKIDQKVADFRDGKFDTLSHPSDLAHFRSSSLQDVKSKDVIQQEDRPKSDTYVLPHPIWTEEQLHSVEITHNEPDGLSDKLAYNTVQLFRLAFDIGSGFKFGSTNEKKWLNRICFLETVAGVPGMVAAMMRHMRSLRRMQRDQGWIHTLLEEAENERMHLLTALQLKRPSLLFRLSVIGSQGFFVTMFGISYAISPKFCHRFVGYLEEEAVKTYTKCLEDIDNGNMKHWRTQLAPDLAVRYWKLKPDATMKDVILAIRADEAHHRVVNHCLASLKKDELNPYKPGQ